MKQLTGLDASFLYMETANSPMHIGGLAIYDPSTAPGGAVGFKQIIANTAARAAKVPAMVSKLAEVPLSMDYPWWLRDGDFDPEFHIRHIALPKPGDWRQLCIQAARIHARPLDRGHPLWEMYIIEGLDNVAGYPPGCFAVLTKMHHAAIDGASGVEIMSAIHDLQPDAALNPVRPVIDGERKPSNLSLMWKAQKSNLTIPFRFLAVAKNTIPSVAKAIGGLASGKLSRIGQIPRTRFNTNVSQHRVFAAVEFDLADIKKIKNALEGVTVNDVAISICGGGLRKYLSSKSELPEQSLVAMAPINIRTEDKQGAAGNEVSQMAVQVCSNVAGGIARLQKVHQGTRNAKELTSAIGAKTMTDYAQFIPSTLSASAAKLASRVGLASRGRPIYNCVITNVPGPQIPLYFTGAEMKSNFGMGPAVDGMGLFQAIGSYNGKFTISVSCCRQMMPDPQFYAQCLRDSFTQLLDETLAQTDHDVNQDVGQESAASQTHGKRRRGKKSGVKQSSSKKKP